MKKIASYCCLLILGLAATLSVVHAQTAPAAPEAPAATPPPPPPGTLEQRVLVPGHNAWMMTSAALVLFMTLPGLALFYGGLVRKKNVLSSARSAWARRSGHHPLVGLRLQLVFGMRSFDSPFLGGLEHFFLQGRHLSAPNTDYATGSRRTSSRCTS
jgi:Amt family ammonium transporter